jgi:8-oxo-dGTP pyrophosphatase MutT (NUDIX family)
MTWTPVMDPNEDEQSLNDPRQWSVLSSSYLSRKPWLTVRQDRVRLPNGTIIGDYNVLEYPDWVNIVAITPEGMAVLVRQYRHGIRAVHYELPAGVCEASDPSPEETARRELLEETGYGGGDWSLLMTLSANPGTHSNRTFTYLANGVVPMQEQRLEDTEELQVHLVSLGELTRILATGGIMQALHAAPLLRYLLFVRG